MADVYVGSYPVAGTSMSHAFIGIERSDGTRLEIHGHPEGSAFPGGLIAAINDSVPLVVSLRAGDELEDEYHSLNLASNVDDSLAEDVLL